MSETPQLRVDAVARRTGLTKRTIRYYDQIGLCAPSGRSLGGFRLYTEADVERLQRIQALKEFAGLTLGEIQELLAAEEVRERLRQRFHEPASTGERVAMLDQAISVLTRQRDLILRKREALDTLLDDYTARLARVRRRRGELAREGRAQRAEASR